MLDYNSFIAFLRDKGYYVQVGARENELIIEPDYCRQITCWVYFTENKIILFSYGSLMNVNYKYLINLFTTKPLLKFYESGSMRVFTLITGIKDE